MAIDNGMIARSEDLLKAEFLFDRQYLAPNLASALNDKISISSEIDPMF